MAPAAAGARLHSPADFDDALVAFGAAWMQELLREGTFYVDVTGTLRVRKESA